MLQRADFDAHFSGVTDLGNGIYRCQDNLPRATIYYYFKIASLASEQSDFLTVSENKADDNFARVVLACAHQAGDAKGLTVVPLPQNQFGFLQLLVAPREYHNYFKTRFGENGASLAWCIPSHPCELTGKESAADLSALLREIIKTTAWDRQIAPKILLQLNNPKTGVGTVAAGVYIDLDYLHAEIGFLDGVADGYIDITNYKDEVMKILSPSAGQYVIRAGDHSTDRAVKKAELRPLVQAFVTA